MPTNAVYLGSTPSFKTVSVLHSCFMQFGHILISLTPTAILQTTKDEMIVFVHACVLSMFC